MILRKRVRGLQKLVPRQRPRLPAQKRRIPQNRRRSPVHAGGGDRNQDEESKIFYIYIIAGDKERIRLRHICQETNGL